MPSPIAHSFAGCIISNLSAFRPVSGRTRFPKSRSQSLTTPTRSTRFPFALDLTTLYGILVSNLPDLDFLPQLITGERFHRGPTHSLCTALGISLLLSLMVTLLAHQARYKQLLALTLALYLTHLLMDFVTAGGSGMQLLWPLSQRYFQAPFPVFPGVHHSRGLWDISHLVFISVEIVYALCVAIALRFFNPLKGTIRLPWRL